MSQIEHIKYKMNNYYIYLKTQIIDFSLIITKNSKYNDLQYNIRHSG